MKKDETFDRIRKFVPNSASGQAASRRRFLKTGSGLAAGAAIAPFLSEQASAQSANRRAANDGDLLARLQRQSRDPQGRILIKNGSIVTMDPQVGDFAKGDLLIEGTKISKIAPSIDVKAEVFDATDMILIPGFADTHRHCWQNQLRRIVPNVDGGNYTTIFHQFFAPFYRPEDMYAGNYISALGCIDAGVTCLMDWSHNARTAAHSDAAIQALLDSGIRAVHGYGAPLFGNWDHQHPKDFERLRTKYFSSTDQLVTICIATLAFVDWKYDDIKFARDHGLRMTIDGFAGNPQNMDDFVQRGLLGPDMTYIHCTHISDNAWRKVKETGGCVGMAPTSDTQLGLGPSIVPVQKALDFGIRPGLSCDVEIALPTDFFTEMRVALCFQHSDVYNRAYNKVPNPPPAITARDVLEFATVQGAKGNGLLDKCGSITPGKEADIVLLTANEINNMPVNNVIGTVVNGCDTRNVDTVIIGGTVRKFRGKLVDVDIEKVRRIVHQSRDALIARSGYQLDIFSEKTQGEIPAGASLPTQRL